MGKMTKTVSPEVDRTMQRKALNYKARSAAFWGIINIFLIIITLTEM